MTERNYPYVDEHEFNCENVMRAPKEITVQDCDELYAQFKKYTETAEQHEFVVLAMVNKKLDKTMADIHEAGKVTISQSEARAMFRTVLRVIHKDFSEYKEVECV